MVDHAGRKRARLTHPGAHNQPRLLARLLVPQGRDPLFDPVEDKRQSVAVVGRPGDVIAGCRGSRWGMKIVSRIIWVRVAVPLALPGALGMHLSVVDFEVVVRVPAPSKRRLVDGRWIARRCEHDMKFEIAAGVRDGRLFDLVRGLEACLSKLEDWMVDRGRAAPIAY